MEAYRGMMELIKDLSVVIGLWILFYNISAWQREHKGRRNIDLAEETLALFYEAKDAVAWIRSPLGFEGETNSIKQGDLESIEHYNARKRASIVYVRFNQYKELFNKIQSLRYRFMVQIGKEETKPFDDLNKVVKEIVTSAHLLAILWPEKNFKTDDDRIKHFNKIQEAENIFWDTLSDKDPINPKLDRVIADMEEICKNIIVPQGKWYDILNLDIEKIFMPKRRVG